MPLPSTIATELEKLGLELQQDAPLQKRTWWRTGGLADGFAHVGSVEALASVQRLCTDANCPVFVLGNASNLLISDRGIRGLVIRLNGELARVELDESTPPVLTVGAGVKLMSFVNKMQRMGWTGLELLAGIPGTIGGAVRMNAGTALGEVVDRLVSVELVSSSGQVNWLEAEALNMRYRHCELPAGAIVARARFTTTGADQTESRDQIRHHLEYRARTQPVDVPTCGSTFRNPPGDTAGRLIDSAGLKGCRIGGAEVSEKHANFIVNTGTASADDIRDLIEHVQAEVQRIHGVSLHREVHYSGDWSHRD